MRRFHLRPDSWRKKKRQSRPALRRFFSHGLRRCLRVYGSTNSASSDGMGTSVPNRPSASPLRPAVKNNVVVGPAPPPLPNPRAHNPSMVRIELFGFRISPRNFPEKGLNAAIWPLPNCPIKSSLLNSPKSRGARATPHGAFTHGLHVERNEVARGVTVECALEIVVVPRHEVETRVVHFDPAAVEVSDKQETLAVLFADRGALIDGILLRVVHDQHGIRVHCGVPAGDGAVFCDKDEAGRLGRREEKVRGAAVKYGAGGRGWRRLALWGRDRDAEQLGAGAAVVDGGHARVIVGNPPGAGCAACETPRILQLAVRQILRRHEAIGHQVCLDVVLAQAYRWKHEE